MTDVALTAGLSLASPLITHFVELKLQDRTVCWTDGGFALWNGAYFKARDEVYGVIGTLPTFEDGADGQATRCSITILPPDAAAVVALTAPSVQTSPISVYLGAVDRVTGLLIGQPDPLFVGELDFGRLSVSDSMAVILECGTEEARQLEPNADQRLSPSYHKAIWSGERGLDHLDNIKRRTHWNYNR